MSHGSSTLPGAVRSVLSPVSRSQTGEKASVAFLGQQSRWRLCLAVLVTLAESCKERVECEALQFCASPVPPFG